MAASTASGAMEQVPRIVEDFTVDLYKNLANKIQGNFVSSALSAHIVLAMATYGASGVTAEEMRNVLRLRGKDEEIHRGFYEFINDIDNVSNVTLKLANKVYGSHLLKIKDSFKKFTDSHFSAQTEILDFVKPESIKIINDWCKNKTNGKIPDMLKPNDVSEDTMMILLNAVYFKGTWEETFNKLFTVPKPFHIDEKTTVDVPMMNIEKKLFYRELKEIDAKCIAIPYQNQDVVMLIIVPNKVDGLKKIENQLEKITFDHKKDFQGDHFKISLSLPKFKIESEIDMIPLLKTMGISTAFTNSANFSGISNDPLKIDVVRQKAVIEVNEEGSEAAAVTEMLILLGATLDTDRIELEVDKPFIYKIMWKDSTIFSGRIVNPLAKSI